MPGYLIELSNFLWGGFFRKMRQVIRGHHFSGICIKIYGRSQTNIYSHTNSNLGCTYHKFGVWTGLEKLVVSISFWCRFWNLDVIKCILINFEQLWASLGNFEQLWAIFLRIICWLEGFIRKFRKAWWAFSFKFWH